MIRVRHEMVSVLFQHLVENLAPSVCSRCSSGLSRSFGGLCRGGCPAPTFAAGAVVRLGAAFPMFVQGGTDATVSSILRVPCRIRPGTNFTEGTPFSALSLSCFGPFSPSLESPERPPLKNQSHKNSHRGCREPELGLCYSES